MSKGTFSDVAAQYAANLEKVEWYNIFGLFVRMFVQSSHFSCEQNITKITVKVGS